MRVLVVTNMYPTPQTPDEGTFVAAQVESLHKLGVRVDVLHLPRIGDGRRVYKGLGRKVKQAVAEHRPDLVHVSYGGLTAYLVTRAIRDRPVLVTYHGSDLISSAGSAPLLRALTLHAGILASRRAARRAAGIIVVSRNLYDALPPSLDYGRVWIVPMGVDMTRFRPLDRHECQRRLGWDPTRRHVLFPASPARPEKRFALAEATVAVLRTRRLPDVELHMLKGIPNEEVPTWLNAANAILLTSTHEGSPVVVKEALACNVPVISVDVGDVRERIAGVECSFTADATPQDLADKLGRALEHEERIDARERIAELSLEAIAERIHAIYALVTGAGAAHAPAWSLGEFAMLATGAAWPPNALVLLRNVRDRRRRAPWRGYVSTGDSGNAELDASIRRAIAWIEHSQDRLGSGGVACYQFDGWTSGYPEVTGYTIPTFWDAARVLERPALGERARRMADWELTMQDREGGFPSLYETDHRPPVVFNTGQVIRGLLRTYEETDDERYLDASRRAADWMVRSQEEDGSWGKANYRGLKRVYDTYAAAALAQLWAVTGEERYARAAVASCEFAIRHQLTNGWFSLCDNGRRFAGAPSTHTICYTVDGLLEIGTILEEEDFRAAAKRTASRLKDLVDPPGFFPGAYDETWTPRGSYSCVTGAAQLGVILVRLHEETGESSNLDVASRLLDFLVYVQRLNAVGTDRSGGLPGSYPIWGRYVPLKYPSWAAKFFIDFGLAYQAARGRVVLAGDCGAADGGERAGRPGESPPGVERSADDPRRLQGHS
jgi:glycosyltransferase involved in cell wall biosynthesis